VNRTWFVRGLKESGIHVETGAAPHPITALEMANAPEAPKVNQGCWRNRVDAWRSEKPDVSRFHTPVESVERPVLADCNSSFAMPNIPQPGLVVKATWRAPTARSSGDTSKGA